MARRRPSATPSANLAADLKVKTAIAFLRHNEDLYQNTRNPRYVWQAWQVTRQLKLPIPEWVSRFIDALAATEVVKRTRATETADRYEAALTAMEVAVDVHSRRLEVRKVAKHYGVSVAISRRDAPNLSAIARVAARDNGVSVNRLLARYRASRKTSKR